MTHKLFRFGAAGSEKPGLLSAQGLHYDVSAFGEDFGEQFFASNGIQRLSQWFAQHQQSCTQLQPGNFRFGPAVTRPSKLVCIGLNYRDHALETGAAVPAEPVLFMKATTAICGPFDQLVIPRNSQKTDYEVELACVIGKTAQYVEKAQALDHVAGYVLHNDYSEREFQKERGGQFTKGKSADTFAPLGPYLVPDANLDASALRLWLRVNGELCQDGTTRELLFDVPTLVSYISQFMTLLPGDVISTGTPAGVGAGRKPPVYLKPGDRVEYGIDGLGEARQHVIAYAGR